MKELYFSQGSISKDEIVITNVKDIHHLKNVHRKKHGDTMMVVADGVRYYCIISEITQEKGVFTILSQKNIDTENVEIDVALAVLKQDKMHMAIQKLSELGLNALIPIQTQNCVVKLESKKEKWDLIALETLKQCGGDKKLEIYELIALDNLKLESYDLALVAWENERVQTLKELILEKKPKKILYIIGPEGGFSPKEIEKLLKKNVKSVTLGKNILRAETAAIVLGGILKYECK